MKVFFNPAYTNFVYQNLEKNPLQFDQKVCNTEGLLDLLELHAGIHTSIKDEMGRRLEYCKAMAKYIEENQPLAVVCGHIHEGAGMEKIGETLVINPGSLGEAGSYAQMEIEKEGEFWQIKDAKICKL